MLGLPWAVLLLVLKGNETNISSQKKKQMACPVSKERRHRRAELMEERCSFALTTDFVYGEEKARRSL